MRTEPCTRGLARDRARAAGPAHRLGGERAGFHVAVSAHASDMDRKPAMTAFAAPAGRGLGSIRILHLVRQYSPSIGGLETYVEQLTARQAERHFTAILTLNRTWGDQTRLPRLQRLNGIPIIRAPFVGCRQMFLPLVHPALAKRFDVVHVHAADQLLHWAHLAHRLFKVPYVVTSHGWFFHSSGWRRSKKLYFEHITRRALRHAAAVLSVSSNDRAIAEEVGLNSPLLRNPIVPLKGPMASGRDLIYIGRLSPTKGIERLIDFLARVREIDPDQTLHIVGRDSEGVGDTLRQRASAIGQASAIRLHGFLPREELARLCISCGFVVSASPYEGFGLSVVEGMSLGLVPILHDNAAFRETHALSGVGLLADFDAPREAADAYLAWRDTVSRSDRERARSFARAHSWDQVVAEIERRYLDACTRC